MKIMTIKTYNPDTDAFETTGSARAQSSPWGRIQVKYKYQGQRGRKGAGLHFVMTASHGGFMVSRKFAEKNLSPAAIKQGLVYGGYLCYEEDCNAYIIHQELGHLVNVVQHRTLLQEEILNSLCKWNYDYVLETQPELNEEQETILNRELNRRGLTSFQLTTEEV